MKEDYKEAWAKFSNKYLYVLSPSTPSKGDVEIIESYLKRILENNKEPDILILGCTLNYRKLFSKYKLYVEMAEINEEMFKANSLGLKGMELNEKLIRQDWLTMKLDKQYDLIVGDFAIANVPIEKRDIFCESVKKHLKDDGLFITRVCIKPKTSVKEIIDYFKDKEVNRENLSMMWWDAVFYFGYDEKTKTIKNNGYLALFEELKKNGMEKWIKPYEEYIPTEEKVWSLPTEKEQDDQIKKHFKISKIEYAKDYKNSDTCPTYVLEK